MSPRSVIYIDGFNLYYGAVKGTLYKWLDIERYFRLTRHHDEIVQIYYFTALIDGRTSDNQKTYLRALATSPLIEIILGKFKYKNLFCRVKHCDFQGSKRFRVSEEKRTDVNIALQMMDDAFNERCENFILVTGDSDLVPAVQRVKSFSPDKKIIVYIPSRNHRRSAATELRAVADKHSDLPLLLLKRSQYPSRIPDGSGGYIEKPDSW